MLVLTRRVDEKIYVGEEIKITVTKIYGNRVLIGIDAPEHISVLRKEVFDRMKAEREGLLP